MRFVRLRFGPFAARFALTMASNDRLLRHAYILTVVPAHLTVGFLVQIFCHRLRMLTWYAYYGRARAPSSVPGVQMRVVIYDGLVAASLHRNILELVQTLTVRILSFCVSLRAVVLLNDRTRYRRDGGPTACSTTCTIY